MTENYKIRPFLVDNKHMHDFYKNLLDNGYQIKIWSKNQDKIIYKYFLPAIREYMFWTFNLKEINKFKSMDNEMQSAICNNYHCTIFEKDKIEVICFYTGIVLIIAENSKDIKNIAHYEYGQNIEDINIDKSKVYKVSIQEEPDLYNYIISLYKFITLRKLEKDMDNKDLFYKNRKLFVTFVEEIYNKKITDNLSGNKLSNNWDEELGLDKLYIAVENKFDLLYKNSKLDNHNNMIKIIIILLVVLIIIFTINLGNWIG